MSYELVDLVEELNTRTGLTGHFLLSDELGVFYILPFEFVGETRQLRLPSDARQKLGDLSELESQMYSDALEAWLAHRDALSDLN